MDLNRQGLGEEGQMASWHMRMARPYSQEGKFELEISDFDDQIIEDPKSDKLCWQRYWNFPRVFSNPANGSIRRLSS